MRVPLPLPLAAGLRRLASELGMSQRDVMRLALCRELGMDYDEVMSGEATTKAA